MEIDNCQVLRKLVFLTTSHRIAENCASKIDFGIVILNSRYISAYYPTATVTLQEILKRVWQINREQLFQPAHLFS